jgi:poly-gamma-glutamate synthesis protein (capsule biosynthesis protein)
MKDEATFAFVGDIIFDARANAAAAAGCPERVWGDVLPVMRGADAVFANLENPLTRSEHRWRRTLKPVCLKSEPATIGLLTAANIAFVNIANNHTMDYEAEGLAETIGLLRQAGIAYAGAGPDMEAASRPVLVQAGGMTVGAIAFTDNTPAFAATATRAGTHHLRVRDDPATIGLIARQVRQLRAEGARMIVLSAHWGPNLRPWPPAHFRRFARAAIDAGVDIFHGHSAHILQGVERYGGGVILYDTGDFIDDVWWLTFVPHFTGALFLVDVADGRVRDLRVVPTVMGPGCVRLGRGALARRVIARLTRLSPPGHGWARGKARAQHFLHAHLAGEPDAAGDPLSLAG